MHRFLAILLVIIPFFAFAQKYSSNNYFIENKGQIIDQNNNLNNNILFLLPIPGMNIQLRKTGFSYDLYKIPEKVNPEQNKNAAQDISNPDTSRILFHRIDFDFVDINPELEIISSDILPDKLNYYTTATPVQGVTGVRMYRKITYKNIYKGIDIEFISSDKTSFKYNFIIHPGADIASVKFGINGPLNVELSDGTLSLMTSLGNIDERIPESYYELNGVRTIVKSHFKKIGNKKYGIELESSIPSSAILVIDPVPERIWGTYYGGNNTDMDSYCAVDTSNGDVYLTGHAQSPNNIATSGAFQGTITGGYDAFLAKFTNSGIRIWGTYYGGGYDDEFKGICICQNYLILTGHSNSSTNIATPGAYQTSLGSLSGDAMIVKFDTAGLRIWGSYYGGNGIDEGFSCDVDSNGNIYIAGITASSNAISSLGSQQEIYGGGTFDTFLAKFSSNGNRLWGTYYGGTLSDNSANCILDENLIYLCGSTASTTNISTSGSYQPNLAGLNDAFLAKFNSNGVRQWGTYFGGIDQDGFSSIKIKKNHKIIVGGQTSSDNISTPGCFQSINGGNKDALLCEFSESGILQWATYYGGDQYDETFDIELINDEIYLAGITQSLSAISTIGSFQETYAGGWEDSFLIKFDSAGSRVWGTYWGGENDDKIFSCSSKGNDFFIAGYTSSLTGISTLSSHQPIYGGGVFDNFLIKFNVCPKPDSAALITGPSQVCLPSANVNYSIPLITQATSYHWNLPSGATIVSGNNTNSITVDFSASTIAGTISVYGVNSCGIGDSTSLVISVTLNDTVTVTISASDNNICTGTSVNYTATPVNPGIIPTYQWKVNGLNTGTNNPTFSYTPLNNDVVTCVLTSSLTTCISNNPATSNAITMVVNPILPIGIGITASENPACSGNLVIFSANPTVVVSNPVFQWKVNGVVVGTNQSTYSYNPLDGDVVKCTLSSNDVCVTGSPVTSNEITMIVGISQMVDVSISPSANNVCAAALVTFTATPAHPGLTPTYQWTVNGMNVGSNSPIYTYTPLNGDIVKCFLTSSITSCLTNNPAQSNQIAMVVNPVVPVSVIVNPSQNNICAGTQVIFTANPTGEGTSPTYQWKVNGINVGTNQNTYTYTPVNNDIVICSLASSEQCPSSTLVTSPPVQMTVIQNLTVGVTISASTNPVCSGIPVTFTASPSNGGITPSYQWKLNGTNVGTNQNTYTFSPSNGDVVECRLTTSILSCALPLTAISAPVSMVISALPVVTTSVCLDSVTTTNAKPFYLKGSIPPGGTYSGPGVNSATGLFTPSLAGTGTKTITYSYTNNALCSDSKSKNIIVQAPANFTCGNPFRDIRDNRNYLTVLIGTQCWFAGELDYGTEINLNQHQRDNCLAEKYHNPASGIQHPASAYQWDELMQYTDSPGQQGLCPPAWHIPTETEWQTLFNTFSGIAFAASPLKYSGFSGFNALLSGASHQNSSWNYQNFATFFWTSSSHGPYKAWAHGMNEMDPSASTYPASRQDAFGVRCVKD